MSTKQEMQAQIEELQRQLTNAAKAQEELEALKAKQAESLAKKRAKPVEYLQLNGFLTVPNGKGQDFVGKRAKVTFTVEGVFTRSKSGNATVRLTAKVPVGQVIVEGKALEPFGAKEVESPTSSSLEDAIVTLEG